MRLIFFILLIFSFATNILLPENIKSAILVSGAELL